MSCKLLVPPYNEVQLSRSRQRLEDEYDSNVIVTAPTVPYKGMQLKVLESRASADS
jgi:translation elongation factor EF-4